MNYKGLAYKTEWIEYPDIEAVCKKIGAAPTNKKPDGRKKYTLPAIYDPNTNRAVADSLQIAKYLDETYPDTPQLFPPGTAAFQAAFLAFYVPAVEYPEAFISIARTADRLNPPSSVWLRTSREQVLGKLEDLNTPEAWGNLEKGLGQVKEFLGANGEGKNLSFLGKGSFTFCDFQVAAGLLWVRTVAGEESEDWKKIVGFHGGFVGKFLEQFEKYQTLN